jgi:hypothetical protein
MENPGACLNASGEWRDALETRPFTRCEINVNKIDTDYRDSWLDTVHNRK